MDEKLKDIDQEDLYVMAIAMLPENEKLVKKLIEDELIIEEACRRC